MATVRWDICDNVPSHVASWSSEERLLPAGRAANSEMITTASAGSGDGPSQEQGRSGSSEAEESLGGRSDHVGCLGIEI